MLKVSRTPDGEPEIFRSIQGEGVTCGLPSIFVRLALCNLRCRWCDTAYTWDWDRYDPRESIIEMSYAEIVDRVTQLRQPDPESAPGVSNVVLTGGEPMLQQADLAVLVGSIKSRGMRVEIETNGTVAPNEPLRNLVDQWNVSPKLISSGNAPEPAGAGHGILSYPDLPGSYFKFVIVEPADVDEVNRLVKRHQLEPGRVILMPEGIEPATILERSQWIAERCSANGYRLGTRLHILLWGNERGR